MGKRLTIIVSGKRNIENIDIDFTYDGITGNKRLKDFVDRVTKAAEITFESHVPKKTGKMLAATTSSTTRKTPTGWEASAGVEPIRSEVTIGKQRYPIYVTRGTGLWGPTGNIIEKEYSGNVDYFIKGGKRPDVFYFEKEGEKVFTTYFKGQPPKLILEHTKDDPKLQSVVRIAKQDLGRNLTKLFDPKIT